MGAFWGVVSWCDHFGPEIQKVLDTIGGPLQSMKKTEKKEGQFIEKKKKKWNPKPAMTVSFWGKNPAQHQATL